MLSWVERELFFISPGLVISATSLEKFIALVKRSLPLIQPAVYVYLVKNIKF